MINTAALVIHMQSGPVQPHVGNSAFARNILEVLWSFWNTRRCYLNLHALFCFCTVATGCMGLFSGEIPCGTAMRTRVVNVQLPTDARVCSKHVYDLCLRLSHMDLMSSEIKSRLLVVLLPGRLINGELEVLGRLERWHWQRPCDLRTLMNG